MTMFRERLWLTHRRRLETDFCPLCFSPIKWIYDGCIWIPCDREPILVYPSIGNKTAVINRELVNDCALFSDGAINGKRPILAHMPHVFTCSELRGKRRDN